MRAEIDRAVNADVDAMRGLLAALVSVPTENPPGRCYRECVVLIEAALASLGIEHRRVQIPAADLPREAVFAWIGGPGPTLYFHGHYDVVPAASPDQFAPRIDGDALFGRGSSDMKSGLVAMLYAAKTFRDVVRNPRGRLGLVFVPDEETGGAGGSGALAAAGLLARDAVGMLLPEPTSGVIWNANRGALSLDVAVKGRAAHVGLQHHGVNAFERAVGIVNRLLALKQEVDRAHSILLVGGRVDAGTNFNIVPDECRFTIDRRMNPEEDFEAEKARVLAILNDARTEGIELDVRTIQEGRSAATASTAALATALAASATDIAGEAPRFEVCPGLLEIRFYAERGVPALAYGPGILAVSHGPQEFVRVSRMVECAKIYALTAARLLMRS